jgi:hypothetical protein
MYHDWDADDFGSVTPFASQETNPDREPTPMTRANGGGGGHEEDSQDGYGHGEVKAYSPNLAEEGSQGPHPVKRGREGADMAFPLRKRSGRRRKKQAKRFNDSVHGFITMDPLCVAIIDTPEFQRLAGIKQLGACDHVFRGATHSR